LIYYEAYLEQADAIGRECYLKVEQADDFQKLSFQTISKEIQ